MTTWSPHVAELAVKPPAFPWNVCAQEKLRQGGDLLRRCPDKTRRALQADLLFRVLWCDVVSADGISQMSAQLMSITPYSRFSRMPVMSSCAVVMPRGCGIIHAANQEIGEPVLPGTCAQCAVCADTCLINMVWRCLEYSVRIFTSFSTPGRPAP